MASALTTSLAYDGQTAPVANLPMATYAHTNVGNATVRTMYASAGQVQDGTLTYLTSISGTDTITAIAPISMSALVAGQTFRFIASGANTTTGVTLNINSIGAKNITKNGATALAIDDIKNGQIVSVVYDGTQFQLLNPAFITVSSFSAGSTGLTPSTATTGAVTLAGTLAIANGGTGQTSSTGSGAVVLATSPTLVTPALGTPSALVGTNITGTSNSFNAGIGVNQTWTDVKASRALGTTYTNSTGKPIMVSVAITDTSANYIHYMYVGSVLVSQTYMGSNINAATFPMSTIVPDGATYSVSTGSGGTITVWSELR